MTRIRSIAIASMLLLALSIVGCAGGVGSAGGKVRDARGDSSDAGKDATSGAYPYEKSPLLKDAALLPAAAATIEDVRSLRVLAHTTAKRSGDLSRADDDEIVFVSPMSAHRRYQSLLTGGRSETIRVGDKVWMSVDGQPWSRVTTDVASYDWQPTELAELLRTAKKVRLFKTGVAQEWSASCTVVEFQRPSPVYKGETQQVVVYIDETTKLPVRFEFLDDRRKPSDFTETFFRLADYDSSELSVKAPK